MEKTNNLNTIVDTTTPAQEPEVIETRESVDIIPETLPEVNDVDQELIFHAPEEEGEDDE